MNYKQQYIQFCKNNRLPLQMQPWWLDAVCGLAGWEVCLAYNKGGDVIGALPFYVKKKWNLRLLTMPPLTDYIGIFMKLPIDKALKLVRKNTLENKILSDLIKQLPSTSFFNQCYYPSLQNHLPFYWAGYAQTTLYTFRINSLNIDEIYAGFKPSIRKDIQKAARQVVVEKSDDLQAFYAINTKSFKRQKMKNPYDFDILTALNKQLKKRNQCQIYIARGKEENNIHAALYLVWDDETAYFLLSGVDNVLKKSAALTYIYWKAIEECVKAGKKIDFCGSMIPGVEFVLRMLGAESVPYHKITKASSKYLKIVSIVLNKGYH